MKRTHILLAIVVAVLMGVVPLAVGAQTGAGSGGTGAIEGAVFLDGNDNGAFDAEEAGVSGVRVRLTGEGEDRTEQTESGGLYRFAGVEDGRYKVAVEPDEPYAAADPDRAMYEDLVIAGDTLTSVDFAVTTSDDAAAADSRAVAAATATRRASATPRASATEKVATTPVDVATATEEATTAPVAVATAVETLAATAESLPTATTAPLAVGVTRGGGDTTTTIAVTPAEQMPQTGFEDWGSGGLLAAAIAVLVMVAAAGWLMERRG